MIAYSKNTLFQTQKAIDVSQCTDQIKSTQVISVQTNVNDESLFINENFVNIVFTQFEVLFLNFSLLTKAYP